ncbi:PAS domain-containing protein [Sphingobium sufflavum]|uniref:PAS domain-containing protein n=1 Tax=Sphingobium sufflavum TaxID=1129547 RepID=UPI001F1BBA61|nr:PAS domain-containing protein [Sphingobium sufflavum]MCE7795100.1 PAS domain-containing protein [Sphingobium sufflavum]
MPLSSRHPPSLPLPLNHSWPLFEAREQLDVSPLAPFRLGATPSPAAVADVEGALARHGIGVWDCRLLDNRVTWSAGVYDLFGLPRGMVMDRALSVSLYTPASRAVMEELRAYAIRYRRGFTVDAELRQPGGDHRWMRLSAVPVVEEGKVVRLCGVKIDVTAEYDGGVRQSLAA